MLARPLLLLLAFATLGACGEVTLGSGRDGRARGGQPSVDETDAGGMSGTADAGTTQGGTAALAASGGRGEAGRAGGSGFAGGGGIAGGGGTAGSTAASGGGSGGPVGDPLRCEPPLAPMLDGPSAISVRSTPLAGIDGDFDGDGRLDLATVNLDASVSVFLGNGNGSFRPGETHDADLLPDALYGTGRIAAADLDADHVLDLVALHDGDAVVKVLLGKGDGTFAAPIRYAVSEGPVALAIEDWDRDGHPDVAYADSSGVRVLWNRGDGSFGVPTDAFDLVHDLGDRDNALAAGDFDEDGRLDLLVSGLHGVGVLRGDGNRGFVPTTTATSVGTARAFTVGDFNRDHHLDVLGMTTCTKGQDSIVWVWFGAGDASFAEPVSYEPIPCLNESAVADVDGDGNIDVIASLTYVMPGNESGGLEAAVTSTAPAGGEILAVGDFNGDSQPDLAAVVDDLIAVHAGNGDGTFGAVPKVAEVTNLTSVALGDLNGDGNLDVATTTRTWDVANSTSASLNLSFGLGDGTFAMVRSQDTTDGTAPAVQIADLNHDGQLDLVTTGDASSSVGVLMGIGGGNFATRHDIATAGLTWAASIADLDGDDVLDIVSVTQFPWKLSLLFGVGDGNFTPHSDLTLGHNPAGVAAGDVNGDGIVDLVVAAYNDAVVSVLAGLGGGGFAPPEDYRIGEHAAAVALGDLNGDHALDIATADYYSMSILFGNGDGTFRAPKDYVLDVTELTMVDFNADGHLDIVVGGSPPQVMFGAGDGTFPCSAFYALGTHSQSVAVGDLNHDGRLDLVAWVADLNVFLNVPR